MSALGAAAPAASRASAARGRPGGSAGAAASGRARPLRRPRCPARAVERGGRAAGGRAVRAGARRTHGGGGALRQEELGQRAGQRSHRSPPSSSATPAAATSDERESPTATAAAADVGQGQAGGYPPSADGAADVVRRLARRREASASRAAPTTSRCAAVVLGGGVANPTTYPLTAYRAKPAVPLGANYRLIDVPISNCINSGINKVFVLTQFNSLSLNRHLSRAYPQGAFGGTSALSVDVLAASQTPGNMDWTEGSADAVRSHMQELTSDVVPHERADDYLILAGEHLYRMDYGDLLDRHHATGADITISSVPVATDNPALLGVDGSGLGVLRLDADGRVRAFVEKPSRAEVDAMVAEGAREHTHGTPEKPLIANMGVYIFSRRALEELLLGSTPEPMMDFGRDVLPYAVRAGYRVYASVFHGYWRDISTLRAFHETNLELAQNPAPFSLHDRDLPMYTVSRNLPPTKVVGTCALDQVLMGEGCFITDANISNSVLGNGSIIRAGCTIENTYMMGADPSEYAEDYVHLGDGSGSQLPRVRLPNANGSGARSGVQTPNLPITWEVDNRAAAQAAAARAARTPVGIGENSVVRNAIIDRNSHIGANCRLVNAEGVVEANREGDGFVISSGIITVLKNAVLPDGTCI